MKKIKSYFALLTIIVGVNSILLGVGSKLKLINFDFSKETSIKSNNIESTTEVKSNPSFSGCSNCNLCMKCFKQSNEDILEQIKGKDIKK